MPNAAISQQFLRTRPPVAINPDVSQIPSFPRLLYRSKSAFRALVVDAFLVWTKNHATDMNDTCTDCPYMYHREKDCIGPGL